VADEPKVPVKLADAKAGDYVVIQHRSRFKDNPENWRLTRVERRTPKVIAVFSLGKFTTTGRPFGLSNRQYRLFDPTPEAMAGVATTKAREDGIAAARAAAEAAQRAEDEEKARKAADWLANRGAADLLGSLPTDALRDMWEWIEPRLTEKTDAVP
jgi:hypothetical protein